MLFSTKTTELKKRVGSNPPVEKMSCANLKERLEYYVGFVNSSIENALVWYCYKAFQRVKSC